MSLRCRWYVFDWHSSLLFTFYKAQKYKDFLKRQKILDIFLRNVEINGIFVVMANKKNASHDLSFNKRVFACRDFTLCKSVFPIEVALGRGGLT